MIIDKQEQRLEDLAKQVIKRFESLQATRQFYEGPWQEIFDHIIPRKAEVNTTLTPGNKRNGALFDSTAIMANQQLSGFLHTMLTNPATRFFELVFGDPSLDSDEQVRGWLQDVGDRMFLVLGNSNFQTEIAEIYLDLGAIGTATLFMGEHPETVVHFAARPIKEIYVDENNLGLIDTVYREFKWGPRQIIQEFGEDKCPKFILEKYEAGKEDKFEIIHAVEAAAQYGAGQPTYFPFKSCYVLREHKYTLSEGGFKEFPYAVPRWSKTSGEVYGRGPGTDMLPDIKMLNRMMETTLKGGQKTVDPPLMVSDDGVIGDVRLIPGGLTVVRAGLDSPIQPLITNARVDFGIQMVEGIRRQIRGGFFVDQLNLAQNDRMTTIEVQQRIQENLRFMGPILGRQQFEGLRPVINRLFGIMSRRGMIPQAPPQIQGKKFEVWYSSPVARAQKMSEAQNFSQAIAVATPIINAQPETLDNIDGDDTLKYIFDTFGLPQKIMRSERDVKARRDARAAAQQQAAQEQQQAAQADVVNKVAPGVAQLQAVQKQGR